MNHLQSKSATISTFALLRVAIPGSTTEEPSVCTATPYRNESKSSKNTLTGIFSSVSLPERSIPTNETNFISG